MAHKQLQVLTAEMTPRGYDVELPDTCPVCHKGGAQIQLGPAFMIGERYFRAVFRCPMNDCSNVYFATYLPGQPSTLLRTEPGMPEPYEVSERIQGLSPKFAPIVRQAHKADQDGLDLIAGPGYRKALEFLVKDYLINFKFKDDSGNQDLVRKSLLGVCIKMLPGAALQKLAARCTWIGNDETHYEPKFPEYDLNDVKALLRLTVREVDNELEADEYLSIEPRK